MKILLLAPSHSPLENYLQGQREDVLRLERAITCADIKEFGIDFIISHGHRHIIKQDVLEAVKFQAINLHISYLPWNRGADPNFWSFIDHTPKGVSLHYIDQGLDTGDLIARDLVIMEEGHTLKSSYDLLQERIFELFKNHWPLIKEGNNARFPQAILKEKGSYHRLKDKFELDFLTRQKGFETPVIELEQCQNYRQCCHIKGQSQRRTLYEK